jgi:hypothetical protein
MRQQQAAGAWDTYLERRLTQADLEPNWVHASYELLRDYAEGKLRDRDDKQMVKAILASLAMPDGHEVKAFPGMPGSPMRIVHDGWKVGTSTWVFMGRALPGSVVESLGNGWVLVGRPIPSDIQRRMTPNAPFCFIAYHRDRQMGGTTFTADCLGPAISREEIVRALQMESGHPVNPSREQERTPRLQDGLIGDGSWRIT